MNKLSLNEELCKIHFNSIPMVRFWKASRPDLFPLYFALQWRVVNLKSREWEEVNCRTNSYKTKDLVTADIGDGREAILYSQLL